MLALHTSLIAAAVFVSFISGAHASTLDDELRETARVGYSRSVSVNGQFFPMYYVGKFNDCDAVSSVQGKHIQNFRVCGGKVIPRNTVSPSWDRRDGARTFAEVQKMAIERGQYSMTDPNGYLVDVHQMSRTRPGCWKYEIIISYEGDLVERDQIYHCSK